MSKSQKSPFEVLGVSASDSDAAVKDAFRRQAFACHPDQNPDDPEAEVRFAEVKIAYDRIRTKELRRSAALEFRMMETAAGGDDAFSDFFRNMDAASPKWNRRYQNIPVNGKDLFRDVAVSLEQSHRGGEFEIKHPAAQCGGCHGAGRIPRPGRHQCPTCAGERVIRGSESRIKIQIECPTCAGRGSVHWIVCNGCGGAGQVPAVSAKVRIRRGVQTGEEIVLAGYGTPGHAGGSAGNLVIKMRVADHPTFRREGDDLIHRIRLYVWDAALGCRKSIRGADGGLVEFVVPSGTQPGGVIRIEDGGMPRKDGGMGALLIVVDVRVPDAGDGKARDIFLRVRKEMS